MQPYESLLPLLLLLLIRYASSKSTRREPMVCAGDLDNACESGLCFDAFDISRNTMRSGCADKSICESAGCSMIQNEFVCCCPHQICNGKSEGLIKARLRLWKRENQGSKQLLPTTLTTEFGTKSVNTAPTNSETTTPVQTEISNLVKSEITVPMRFMVTMGHHEIPVEKQTMELPLSSTAASITTLVTTDTSIEESTALNEVVEGGTFVDNAETLETSATNEEEELTTAHVFVLTREPEFEDTSVLYSSEAQDSGPDPEEQVTENSYETSIDNTSAMPLDESDTELTTEEEEKANSTIHRDEEKEANTTSYQEEEESNTTTQAQEEEEVDTTAHLKEEEEKEAETTPHAEEEEASTTAHVEEEEEEAKTIAPVEEEEEEEKANTAAHVEDEEAKTNAPVEEDEEEEANTTAHAEEEEAKTTADAEEEEEANSTAHPEEEETKITAHPEEAEEVSSAAHPEREEETNTTTHSEEGGEETSTATYLEEGEEETSKATHPEQAGEETSSTTFPEEGEEETGKTDHPEQEGQETTILTYPEEGEEANKTTHPEQAGEETSSSIYPEEGEETSKATHSEEGEEQQQQQQQQANITAHSQEEEEANFTTMGSFPASAEVTPSTVQSFTVTIVAQPTERITPIILHHRDHIAADNAIEGISDISKETKEAEEASTGEATTEAAATNQAVLAEPTVLTSAESTPDVVSDEELIKMERPYPHIPSEDTEELQEIIISATTAMTTSITTATPTTITAPITPTTYSGKKEAVKSQSTTAQLMKPAEAHGHPDDDEEKEDNAAEEDDYSNNGNGHDNDDNGDHNVGSIHDTSSHTADYSDAHKNTDEETSEISDNVRHAAKEETSSPAQVRKTSTLRVERADITIQPRKPDIREKNQESIWKNRMIPWWLVAVLGSLVATLIGGISYRLIRARSSRKAKLGSGTAQEMTPLKKATEAAE